MWPVVATAICWGVVIVVWIAGAVYGARGPRTERQGYSGDALWRVAAAVVVVVLVRFARHDLQRLATHSLWVELPGFVLLVASTVFTLWARVSIGRMWSATPNMLKAGHELRTHGAYGVTRHPIYTGLFGMLLGSVLLNGLGPALAFLVVGVVVLATRIPVEERLMTKTFPDEYPRYRERVPRLVPGLNLLRRPR